jgi:large subunit ribosomal protein L1
MLALGANNAGLNNVIDLLKTNINECDILLTTPNLMSKLIPLGRLLGPKNLLPSLKNGTLTTNLELSVLDFKKGKLEYQVDKFGIVHLVFGKLSFNVNDLKENIKVILNSINKLKLKTTKNFIKSLYICSTMSSAIKINVSTVNCYI